MTQDNKQNPEGISWFPYVLVVTGIMVIGIVVLSVNPPAPAKKSATDGKTATQTVVKSVEADTSDATIKTLTAKNGKEAKVTLPHSEKTTQPNERFAYRFTLNHKAETGTVYTIIPDDCLEKLEINGKPVKLSGDAEKYRCRWGRGFEIDLKEHLKPGANKMLIEISNKGGPSSLKVRIPQ